MDETPDEVAWLGPVGFYVKDGEIWVNLKDLARLALATVQLLNAEGQEEAASALAGFASALVQAGHDTGPTDGDPKLN